MSFIEDFEQLTCKEIINKLQELFDTNQEEEVDECLDLFLFTYNPCGAAHTVLENQDTLKDPILLEIIMTKIREIYEPEIFLETANVVSYLESYEAEIATSGIARAVVVSMDRDSGSVKSQSLGCKILSNLCHNSAVRDWLAKIKAVDKVMGAIKKHQNNAELIIEACHTLTNMSYLSKINKETIVQEHGIEILLDTLTLHKNNVKLINSVLIALRNILNNKMVMELQQHTVTHEVMSAMNFHRQKSEIQSHAIWILIHLMSGKNDIKKHIIEQGALDHIIMAMEIHKTDRAVVFAAAVALGLLAKIATNRMLISKQKGIPLLASALQNHRDAAPLQKAVLKAFFRISANKFIRENLIHKSIIQEIVEVMKYHMSHQAVQRSAIICLLQFAKHPPLRTVIQQEAASHIVMAHNKFNDVVHFQKVSSQAVQLLVITDSNNHLSHSPPTNNDINLLTNQEKEIKDKVQEKEKLIELLTEKKNILDIELEALKELKENQDLTNNKEEFLSKTKKEFSKFCQQRDTLMDDIKKAEAQNKSASLELEILKTKFEEKKSNKKTTNNTTPPSTPPSSERSSESEETPPRKKSEPAKKPRSNTPREKATMEKGISSPNITAKSDREHSRVPPPLEKGISSPAIIPKVENLKKSNPSDRVSKTKERKKSTVKKHEHSLSVTLPSLRHSLDSNLANFFKVKSPKDSKSVRLPIDLAEPPPPITSSSLLQGKPHLERSSSRQLNRHNYTRTQSSNTLNNPNSEIITLKRTLEGLTNIVRDKEKEIIDVKEETRKNEILIQKLSIDLQGSHILIKNLQKEHQTIKVKEKENGSTVGSVVMRQKKKITAYKEQLDAIESENAELKKLLQAVKKQKKKDK